MRYWLFKSEPSAYSYDDLVREGVGTWDGVRNFQARNFLRDDMKPGDLVLFYHSSIDPTAVVGVAEVVREGYPDHTAWDPKNKHFDPKSTREKPQWYMVDVKARERFPHQVTTEEMRGNARLAGMMLLRRGMRLSIQPVTKEEFEAVCAMGRKA